MTTSLILITSGTASARFQQTLTLGPDFTGIQQFFQWLRDRTRPPASPPAIDYDAILVEILNLVMETIYGPGFPAFPPPSISSEPTPLVVIETWEGLEILIEAKLAHLYPEETLWSNIDEYVDPNSGGGDN